MGHSRFNSIVVRLKVDHDIHARLLRRSFNSIVVRLKANIALLLRVGCSSFNSIVVRLKGDHDLVSVCIDEVFQFHSGSIKSVRGIISAR